MNKFLRNLYVDKLKDVKGWDKARSFSYGLVVQPGTKRRVVFKEKERKVRNKGGKVEHCCR